MFSRIKAFFAPPEFPDDEDKTRLSRKLNTLFLIAILFVAFYGGIAVPLLFVEKFLNTIVVLALLIFLGIAYWLMRLGKLRASTILLVSGLWLILTLYMPFAGGLSSGVVVFYLSSTVIAGLMLGSSAAIIYATACCLAGLGMTILEISGHTLPRLFPVGPMVGWINLTIALMASVVILRLVLNHHQETLTSTRQSIDTLRQTEVALRDSEVRFSRLSVVSAEGIGITIHGIIVDANPQLAAMLGYETRELIGMQANDLVAPESRDLVIANEQAEFEGPYEHMAIKKDGTIFPVEIRAKTIPFKGEQARVAIVRDITEHKRVENALRESEAQFRHLWEITVEGIIIHDQGTILEVNEAAYQLFGLTREQVIGKYLLDFAPVETHERIRTSFLTGSQEYFETYYTRPDGKNIILEIYPRQTTYHGKPARMVAIRDITERKQFEKNLSQQIERLRALHTIEQAVTSSMDLHTILDMLVKEIVRQLQVDATSVLLLNPQKQTLDFAAGQGFQTEALKYTSLKFGTGLAGRAAVERQIVHIANLTMLEDNPNLARSIANEKFVSYFGVPLIAKDQVLGVMEIFHRSQLAPDPTWLRFLETLAGQAAISIDNARLLEMTMESLKETNALYMINKDLASTMDPEQLMENTVNLLQKNFGYFYVQIFVIQPETGDFVFRAGSGNIGGQLKHQGYRLAAGEGIVGYTAETGKPFFTNNVDDAISFVRAPFLAETKSELAVPIKAGSRILGLLDIHQVPPAILTELDVQMVSTVADQLAVALQKAQLYSDLQNSLLQEQSIRSQLIHTEKLATAGRLLASVSHELNNPLQAIQNALFLLRNETGISAQGQQDLKIVLSEAERMASLLERLRTTYQPVGSEDFLPVQMNDIIEDVRALVATHLRHASISFEFHSEPDLPTIPGIGDQLKQVLLNLFMNAVDAMPEGGRLVVTTSCSTDRREVLITVSDTGAGIAAAVLPNLFEAFNTNKQNGTGLGLAISYEIILKHRGRIQGENLPEGGAKFSIWLPLENGGLQ